MSKGNTGGQPGVSTVFGIRVPSFLVPVLWGIFILLILAIVIIVGVRVRKQAQVRRQFQEEFAEAERVANAMLEGERDKQQQAWTQQQVQVNAANITEFL